MIQIPSRQSVWATLILVRAWNLILLGSIQYIVTIGIMYGVHRMPSALISLRLFFVALTTSLLGAAGYTLHDYFNTKFVEMIKPRRLVVGKLIRRRDAIILYCIWAALAFIASVAYGPKLLVVVPIALLALWLYSSRLQHLPIIGTVWIAAMSAGVVYLPFWALESWSGDAMIFALYGAIMVVSRQLIKDLRDLPADVRYNVQSFPRTYGIKATKTTMAVVFACFCIALYSLTIFLEENVGVYFLCLLPLLCGLIYYTIRADTIRKYNRSLLLIKAFIVIGALGSLATWL